MLPSAAGTAGELFSTTERLWLCCLDSALAVSCVRDYLSDDSYATDSLTAFSDEAFIEDSDLDTASELARSDDSMLACLAFELAVASELAILAFLLDSLASFLDDALIDESLELVLAVLWLALESPLVALAPTTPITNTASEPSMTRLNLWNGLFLILVTSQ